MGIILDIQKCSYQDGPGIRTTVFLKGCQLHCSWCHNPESISPYPQLQYISNKCISCGDCVNVCPNRVHSITDGVHTVDFHSCKLHKECVELCPTQALNIFGYEISAEDVIKQVLQDKAYYDESGGGVTFSGGEPTQQPEFLYELLRLAKQNHIHTCLETNGYIATKTLHNITPLVDLFLLDYKITDPKLLKKYTGAGGNLWIKALQYLNSLGKPVILRMPIIPGINDNEEHFRKAKELKNTYSVIQDIHIMPYHSIGASKWNEIGLAYTLGHIPQPSAKQVELWRSLIKD